MVVKRADRVGEADEVRVYTKGAPDVLFDYTTHVLNEKGEVVEKDSMCERADQALWKIPGMDKDLGEDGGATTHIDCLERTVKLFASKAYRTILVAYRDMSMQEYDDL